MNFSRFPEKKDRWPRKNRARCVALFFFLSAAILPAAEELNGSKENYRELREEVSALRAEVERLNRAEIERSKSHLPDGPAVSPTELISWGRTLVFTSPDDRFSLGIRGRIQPRYDYERREEESDHSSFFIRRLRLDLQGHAYTRDLTWRIMPEWSRGAGLRDGWANYSFNDFAELRLGQYQTPFAWERDSSNNRHQFVERSIANNEFEWNDGRDIGLMLHGKLTEPLRYAIGVFGGEGRERLETRSTGNLVTGRITYSPIGMYPDSEALLKPVNGSNLAFGLGLGYNTKNTPRDNAWQDANVLGTTADVHFQADRFSSHLTGFYREVDPRGPALSYEGTGYTVQAGYLLMTDRLFSNLRYSYARPNSDLSLGKQREVIAGVQIYQFGHGSKLHLEAGRIQVHNGNEWLNSDIIRTQYQLLF